MKTNTNLMFSGLLAALMLAACSNDSQDLKRASGYAIEFSQPYAGKQSRVLGEIDNENLTESEFKVWGWKDSGDQIFDGKEITYVDGAWTYSPKVLWDTASCCDFVAIAPSDEIGTNLIVNKTAVAINSIPLAQQADQAIDYLVSDPILGITYKDAADGLQFTFRHILGKLQIWAKYTIDEAIADQVSSVDFSQFAITCEGAASYNFYLPYGISPKADYSNLYWTAAIGTKTSMLWQITEAKSLSSEYQLILPPMLMAPTPNGTSLSAKLKLAYHVILDEGNDPLTFDTPETILPSLSCFRQGYVTNLFINLSINNSSLGLISVGIDQKVVEYEEYNNSVDNQGNPNF